MISRNSILIAAIAAVFTSATASAGPQKGSGSVPFAHSCSTNLTLEYYDSCAAMELQAGEQVVIETIAATCWHEVNNYGDELTKVISVHFGFKGIGDAYLQSVPIPLLKSETGPAASTNGGNEARVYYNGVINGPFYAEAGFDNKLKFDSARVSTALSSGYAQCNLVLQGQYL